MTAYPDGSPGVYPLDPDTPVGQFRLLSGDVTSVAYDPVEPGYQNYTNFSDDEITQYITQGADNISAAIGYSYLQAAGAAAIQSKSVSDYDLKVDLTKRSEDLRKIAEFWFNRAAVEGAVDGADEYFDIIELDPTWQETVEGETPPYIWWRS